MSTVKRKAGKDQQRGPSPSGVPDENFGLGMWATCKTAPGTCLVLGSPSGAGASVTSFSGGVGMILFQTLEVKN